MRFMWHQDAGTALWASAFGKRAGAEQAPYGLPAHTELCTDGPLAQPLLVQGEHLLVAKQPSGPTVGLLLLCTRHRGRQRFSCTARFHRCRHWIVRDQCIDGRCCLTQRGLVASEHSLQYLAGILEQMEAVSDLRGVRRAHSCAIGVSTSAITTDHLWLLMLLQLARHRRGRAISK